VLAFSAQPDILRLLRFFILEIILSTDFNDVTICEVKMFALLCCVVKKRANYTQRCGQLRPTQRVGRGSKGEACPLFKNLDSRCTQPACLSCPKDFFFVNLFAFKFGELGKQLVSNYDTFCPLTFAVPPSTLDNVNSCVVPSTQKIRMFRCILFFSLSFPPLSFLCFSFLFLFCLYFLFPSSFFVLSYSSSFFFTTAIRQPQDLPHRA